MTDQGKKIALIDDDDDFNVAAKRFFSTNGYPFDTFSTGEEALQAIAPDGYTHIFVDLKLPGISGLAVIKELVRTEAAETIVPISGYAQSNEALLAKKLCRVFVPKSDAFYATFIDMKTIIDADGPDWK